jgi:hypothetical protein
VGEREVEELESFASARFRLGGVVVHREARHHGDVRIDDLGQRHALVLERRVVVVDPVPRFGRVGEREREGAEPELRREMDRVAVRARDPHRRMRFL